MEYKVLYRKYRPNDFDNIVDQDVIVNTLKNAISSNKVAHAYIFSGPRGTGKTSTAKVFAKALNCENYDNGPCDKCQSCLNFNNNPDIIEIDAASNNGVDDVRELINNVKVAPSISKYKVYIIDEVHMLTTNAFNALLLTLEEPPKNVVFILATTNIESVPITILSRCQRFDFSKITLAALINRIEYVSRKENIDIDKDAISEICTLSEGGMRDALGMLDQLSSQNSKITLDIVQKSYNVISNKLIEQIIAFFLAKDSDNLIKLISEIETKSYDFKNVNKKIIFGLHNYLIENKNDIDVDTIKNLIIELNKLMNDINIYVSPYLLLKTIFISYMSESNEKIDAKTDEKEIKNEITVEKEEKKEEKVEENYFPGNNFDEKTLELKEIRLNNVFVNPSKEILKEKQKEWSNFISKLDDSNLLSLLVDSKIVVSSKDYAVIVTDLEATSHLINTSIIKIEKEFNKKTKGDIKLISTTADDWERLKKEYVKNTKNNINYKILEESKIGYNEEVLKSIAEDTFKNVKIEVE